MGDFAPQLIKNLDDAHLVIFAARLTEWLVADLNQNDDDPATVPAFTGSRAKALLRASGFVDDPTLHDFGRLLETPTAVRLALYDLLQASQLAEHEEVQAMAASASALSSAATIDWLPLAIAAYAHKNGYPLYQLDPASPPNEYSPAGQLLRRAANFIRQQVQRSATERDKWNRKLAHDPTLPPSLEQLPPQSEIAPIPPYFRTPVPVRYPEYARETVRVEPDEPPGPTSSAGQLSISENELPANSSGPMIMPPIRITEEQLQAASPRRRPTAVPPSGANTGQTFNTAVRQRFGGKEPMQAVRLRVIVQEYQDGPGVYGLQVHVRCQGIKAFVAGTTNREGIFLCELPVRVRSGLTYDVDITWPRDFGSETEKKSVTLNIDRKEFVLPFYHRLAR